MSEDLPTRLLAAIEAKAAKARAASRSPWRTRQGSPYLVDGVVYGASEGFPGGDHLEQVCNLHHGRNPADAEHIADNDPKSVLTRCAADLEVLNEHRTIGDGRCRVCTALVDDGAKPGVHAVRGRGTRFRAPCPTVIAMAKGYDLTVEAEADRRG